MVPANSTDTASVIGGFPTVVDLIPSLFLAIAYGLSLLPFIYHLFSKNTRVILPLLHTVLFSIEHSIVFAIRAAQAKGGRVSSGRRADSFFLYYQQVMFGVGFTQLSIDAVTLLRALLTNTTLADQKRGSFDQPERRAQFRSLGKYYDLSYLVVFVLGVIAGGAHGGGTSTTQVIQIRCASAILALLLMIGFVIHLRILRHRVVYLDGRAVDFLCVISLVIMIVPIYRLTVMYNRTPYLPGPGQTPDTSTYSSLTTRGSKIFFYVFHTLPELAVTVTLQSINVRRMFNTGSFGDWRWSDKRGIPRLRENGVHVDGVGIEMKKGKGKRMALVEDVDLEDNESLLSKRAEPQLEPAQLERNSSPR